MAKTHVPLGNLFSRDFIAVLVIVVNAFSWYFPLYVFFQTILEESLTEFSILLAALGIHYAGIVGFAFVGIALDKKFSSRNTFLYLWMLLGVIASAMLILLDTSNIAYLLLVSLLLGVSLGLGFPFCLAYFGDYAIEENRGRLGGITFFASGVGILVIGLPYAGVPSFATGALISTFWRGLGLILFFLIKPKQKNRQSVKDVSYKAILLNRHFALYLVPWIMFCLINFFENPIVNNLVGPNLAFLIPMAEYGIGGLSALVGGWFSDSIGRKRIVIFGFIMPGIGYAVLGIFHENVLSWYLYIVLDGIAWGIFSLMFYLVIWADFAGNRNKEKYYLIGVLPFIVSGYMQVIFTPYTWAFPISVAFSLASFFLFLAVLPLLYAPETLSEKEIEKKRLQKYLEDVEKVKKKYEKG